MNPTAASAAPQPASLKLPIAPPQILVWVLFLFSGICGLIYEVLWCRHLGLLFGNTVQSMSAVLTAFMAGLALGSYVGGRVCERLKRPMMVYGILELAIGIYCAFLPWAFSADSPIVPFYQRLYGESGGGAGLSIARFTISFFLLLIPTTFMGATLPVLSQFLVRSRAFLGKTVGMLYAVNTFGAVLGAALTGFILLPAIGKDYSNWLAVATNIILGSLAVIFGMNAVPAAMQSDDSESSTNDESNSSNAGDSKGRGPQKPISPLALKLSIFTFGLTGFAALTTQIGWNHAISAAMGSSSYIFSLIVSVFILGLSIGGLWGSRAAESTNDPLALLGKVLIAIGLGSIALTILLGKGPQLQLPLLVFGQLAGWNWQLLFQALGIGLLIIGPTFLMGATLPLTMQVAARSDGAPGRTVGTIYAVNTIGSILGSSIGGLFLYPLLGDRGTLLAMAMLYAIPGFILYMMSESGKTRKPPSEFTLIIVAVGAILAVLFFSPQWDPLTMSSGMYLLRDPKSVEAVRNGNWSELFPDLHKDTELKYYAEGATALVAVTKKKEYLIAPPDVRDETPADAAKSAPPATAEKAAPIPSRDIFSLTVGGKPDASSHGDMSTQMGLTMIPELLHEKPEEVLVIGLGSGASAAAALAPDSVKNVDVIEMSPEVVEASFFFAEFTGLKYVPRSPGSDRYWLETPRLNLIVNDGRNHLLLTSKKYDVIASEPSNPWLAGVGNLFTREAFDLSRRHLKPGGVMCQWIHSYSLEEADFFSIVKTFGDVFKHMELWCVNRYDFLLIGSEQDIRMDLGKLRARMTQKAVLPLLQSIHFETEDEFMACFISTDTELRELTQKAALHTDDNMRLEFSAPKALYHTDQLLRSTQFEPDPERALNLNVLAPAERRAVEERLDYAASGREHTRFAFEHAGNRIDHWVKAKDLAPKQIWTVDYAKFIDDAVKARPQPKAPLPPDVELQRISSLAETAGPAKALEELLVIAKRRAATGGTSFECAELAVTILRRAGDRQSAANTLAAALQQPGMDGNPRASGLWRMFAQLTMEADYPDVRAALKYARIADDLARKNVAPTDTVGSVILKMKDYRDAYSEYRDLWATNPNAENFKLGLADALLGNVEALRAQAASDPKMAPTFGEIAARKLRLARRLTREAARYLHDEPAPWLRMARIQLALSEWDENKDAAAYHKNEARQAWAKVVAGEWKDLGDLPTFIAIPKEKQAAQIMRIEKTFSMDVLAFFKVLKEEMSKLK